MRNMSLFIIATAAALTASPVAQAELYQRVSPSAWIVSDAATPDTLTCFDATFDGRLVGLVGLSINLYDADLSFVRTLGTVPNYTSGNEYAAFCRVSPDESEVWVGYTVLGSVDDRIYSVSMGADNATPTLRAKMSGIYEVEFAEAGGEWKPFAGGTNSTTFGSPNKVWLLDTSGADSHVLIADIGGYGCGIAFDAAGNLYAASTQRRLYRFAASDVAAVISGGPALSTADAELTCDIGFGGSDVDVDPAGNVFFNGNDTTYSGKSLIGLFDPLSCTYDNIALGSGSFGNWSTFLAATGSDVLAGDGVLYVGDYYAWQTLTQISVPEPATIGTLLLGSLGLLMRRKMK